MWGYQVRFLKGHLNVHILCSRGITYEDKRSSSWTYTLSFIEDVWEDNVRLSRDHLDVHIHKLLWNIYEGHLRWPGGILYVKIN
jgi:hypothetical protein